MSIHEVDGIEEVATATAARTWKALGDAPIKGSRRPPITAGIAGRIEHTLLGMSATDAAEQCRRVVDLGADELDMVIDVRAVRRDDVVAARDGVRRVVEAAQGHPVKVILETGLLSIEQIVVGCVAAEAGGAAFVKTCTGFGPRGATEQDVKLIRAALGARLGLKASGGIGNRDWAARLVGLGADVIGTSKGPECV
jgi:deoxyribose-phosphate aldolase